VKVVGTARAALPGLLPEDAVTVLYCRKPPDDATRVLLGSLMLRKVSEARALTSNVG